MVALSGGELSVLAGPHLHVAGEIVGDLNEVGLGYLIHLSHNDEALIVAEIIFYLSDEIVEAAADYILVAMGFDGFLKADLLGALSPCLGLVLDAEASVKAVGLQEEHVAHSIEHTFFMEPRCLGVGAFLTVGDGEEHAQEVAVLGSHIAHLAAL